MMDPQELMRSIKNLSNRNLEERKTWYSPAANAYNEVRPKYPDAFVQQVLDVAQLPNHPHVLEVGCGPGTATVSFAQFDGSIECVEPNPDFAAIAKRNCESFSNVTIHNTSFEESTFAPESFDAILAASSFHWIPAEIGYPKAAQLLKKNAPLILLWNKELQPTHEVHQQFSEIYQQYASQQENEPLLDRKYETEATQLEILDALGQFMLDSGQFKDMVRGHLISHVRYTADQYLMLLNTYSPYLMFDPDRKAALFAALKDCIDRHHDGALNLWYPSVFHIARRA